jgi:hypothetical protein
MCILLREKRNDFFFLNDERITNIFLRKKII